MEEKEVLQKIGLNDHEANIYYALLILKESTAVKIAKETGLHRQTVYDTLDKLSKKGLISTIKKDYVNHYSAIEPTALEKFLEEKNQLLDAVMPALMSYYEANNEDIQIDIFKGIEGLNTIIKDVIEQQKEFFMVGAGTPSWKFIKNVKPKLIREFQKIPWKMIQMKSLETTELLKQLKNGKVKFLDKKYESNMAIISYGNRAGLFIVSKEITFIRIIGAGQTFKNYFDLMWNIATE